ncbi:hypothetical protein MRS44_018517 [Fusarium solani]|uniref:uncharacterized protein n=1 Tax=Fusarium solani TaxID=169388 RepID=UPI0032C474A5|nr:hypothetical protein MRS44_018517 [Fusarium solani]
MPPPPPPLPQLRKELALTTPHHLLDNDQVSIVESANRLARERVEEYNAKLTVFQAFCAKFKEAAQLLEPRALRCWTNPQAYVQQRRCLTSCGDPGHLLPLPLNANGPRRREQPATIAPPREDLQVFIRLEAGAPARAPWEGRQGKKQSKWLGKVVALFQELPDRDQLPNTTKTRRETARVNFKQIHDELGCEVFYLCTFSFTITHMGTIKHISELITEIRSWRANKVLPKKICDEEKCRRIFGGTTQCSAYLQMDTSSRDDHSFHGPPLKRCCIGIDEQRTKQTVSHEYSEGNNDIGEGTGDGDNSDVNNGDDDVGIDAEVDDEDDIGRDEAIQDSKYTKPV